MPKTPEIKEIEMENVAKNLVDPKVRKVLREEASSFLRRHGFFATNGEPMSEAT
jgi:hypothetical protein